MKQPGGQFGEQLQMFDTSGMGPKRPGQKGFDEWLDTENPVYHGSFRSDFGEAEAAHFGTRGQAAYRLDAVEHDIRSGGWRRDRYYDPSLGSDADYEDIDPFDHTGRVYARRMTEKPMAGKLIDADANAAEAGFLMEQGYEDWEIPNSVSESAGTMMPTEKPWTASSREELESQIGQPEIEYYSERSRAGARALGQGRPIKYSNFIEGDNPIDREAGVPQRESQTSHIVPRGAQQSWEADVIQDPSTQDWVKDFARNRVEKGEEGAVPFAAMRIPKNAWREDQRNFYDLYDPGAPEPNAPAFPRELALRQQVITEQRRGRTRPMKQEINFRA